MLSVRLVIKRIASGEYFIYHHTKRVHIRRLCRSAILLPELLGSQQLWGHAESRATSSDRSHFSWSTWREGRKPEVSKASLSGHFVGD